MKSFPHDFHEDDDPPKESVQGVFGEISEQPPGRKTRPPEPVKPDQPKKTGQITRDVYRD